MTARELRRARALYIGHMVTRLLGYFCVFFSATWLDLTIYHASFGQVILWIGFVGAGLFLVELVTALAFKRKGRPWRLNPTIPPEDRWPRRG